MSEEDTDYDIISMTAPSASVFAGYYDKKEGDAHRFPVLVWTCLRYTQESFADEVVGQVYDPTQRVVTEANDLKGFGEFLGYFEDKRQGIAAFDEAIRDITDEDEEDEEDEDEEDYIDSDDDEYGVDEDEDEFEDDEDESDEDED